MAKMRWRVYPLNSAEIEEQIVFAIDGVAAELVVVDMGVNDLVDGITAVNMFLNPGSSENPAPYVRRWPVVRDRNGNPIRYNDRLAIVSEAEQLRGTLTIYYYDEGL